MFTTLWTMTSVSHPPPGIGGEPGYPIGGPAADITAAGCSLTEQGAAEGAPRSGRTASPDR